MPGTGTTNRGLIVARVGHGHALHGLLGIARAGRSWDLAFSLYDDIEFDAAACIDIVHRREGGKWDGIHAFFAAYPETVGQHDLFWLVDDDIEVTAPQVEELFSYVRRQGFELAQPALTRDSYYSHRLTLQCPGFRHRHTNFVELMLPVLSRELLEQVLPLFRETRSGLGIDWVWYRYLRRPGEAVAIIDAIAMPHRRPLNRHLRGRMARDGLRALDERRRLLDQLGGQYLYPVAFAGCLADGSMINARGAMAIRMARAYWSVRRELVRIPWSVWDFVVFLFKQALARVD